MDDRRRSFDRLNRRASSSLGYAVGYDGLQRSSSGASGRPQRASVTFSGVSALPEEEQERRPENVFETPPDSPVESVGDNVFATPTNSTPGTPNGSQLDMRSMASTPFSTLRHSLTLSIPRSLSPIGVSDGGYFAGSGGMGGGDYVPGGGGGFYGHSRSVSLSRSITPSVTSTVTGNTLGRSNTVNTHTTGHSSMLYSIPSHLSQMTSPPSPLGSIAPVRPRFDYGEHQQTLSVHGSEYHGSELTDLDDVENPFGDAFVVPVGDGFAPHTDRGMSRDSDTSSSAPPPYTQYPEAAPAKPVAFGEPIRATPSNPDSGVSLRDSEERRRSAPVLAALPGGVVAATAVGREALEDNSGAGKEWRKKEWKGMRIWIVGGGILLALLVGLAVGLGVGLGIGIHRSSGRASTASQSSSSKETTTVNIPPNADSTAPTAAANRSWPVIPTGISIITPLGSYVNKSTCALTMHDTNAPGAGPSFLSTDLWSCDIADASPLTWEFEYWPNGISIVSDLQSSPPAILSADWKGPWGAYIVSSQEGITVRDSALVAYDQDHNRIYYSPSKQDWRVGAQGMLFWNQPVSFINGSSSNRKKRSILDADDDDDGDSVYSFGILYNKTVLLRENVLITMASSHTVIQDWANSNGSTLETGEIAWLCEWQNTLLEVEIHVEESSGDATGTNKNVDNGQDGYINTVAFSIATPTSTVTHYYLPKEGGQTPKEVLYTPLEIPPDLKHKHSPRPSYEPPVNAVPTPPPAPALPDPQPEHKPDGFSNAPQAMVTPPPIVPSSSSSSSFEFVPHETSLGFDANNLMSPTKRDASRFPKKVRLKDYRPSQQRLLEVMGKDQQDVSPGAVICTRVVKISDGGLKEEPFLGGISQVTLVEQMGNSRKLKRDDDTGCQCSWRT